MNKIFYIYKITNLINNKFYIGMHSTKNINDGYFGSGTGLKKSIKKYGKENFKMEILHFLDTKELMIEKEKEIVNEELLSNPLCMNLKPGGSGGFCNEEHKYKFHAAGGKAVRIKFAKIHHKKLKEDNEYRDFWKEQVKRGLIENGHKNGTFFNKTHSKESKEKIGLKNSLNQKGKGNSQYGTMWITNDIINKKIKKEEPIPEGWKLGRKIKK